MALVSDDVLRGIRQLRELEDRILNGTLDPIEIREPLQMIIEKRFLVVEHKIQLGWQPPSWWRSPEDQLLQARKLWPNLDFPEPPDEFVPRSKTEVLLLHVPDTLDNLWNLVNAPEGYTKYRWDGVKSDKRNLRLAPNKVEFTEPVWLAFDPEHGRGARPDSFWDQTDVILAANEVFSALIQFPEWPLAWYNGASTPRLAGYQLKYDGSWSDSVYLDRWDDSRQVGVHARWSDDVFSRCSSPSVREC